MLETPMVLERFGRVCLFGIAKKTANAGACQVDGTSDGDKACEAAVSAF